MPHLQQKHVNAAVFPQSLSEELLLTCRNTSVLSYTRNWSVWSRQRLRLGTDLPAQLTSGIAAYVCSANLRAVKL